MFCFVFFVTGEKNFASSQVYCNLQSILSIQDAPVAQRIEQRFPKPLVAGSTPAWGTVRREMRPGKEPKFSRIRHRGVA
jgi:hypothetical protein